MGMDSKLKSPEQPNSLLDEFYVDVVGREFVKQYYTLLNRAPSHLHRFYAEDSSFVHGALDPVYDERDERNDQPKEGPAYGQIDIHKKIMLLNFQDCKTKIRQVDAHGTLGEGVVVQVSGELSNSGQPMRRFMQTFVLGPQGPKKFYLRNDIFRYQDEVFAVADVCSSSVVLDSEVQLSASYSNYHASNEHSQPRHIQELTNHNVGQEYYNEPNVGQNGFAHQEMNGTSYDMMHGSNFQQSTIGIANEKSVQAMVLEHREPMASTRSLSAVETVPADSSTYASGYVGSPTGCEKDMMMSMNGRSAATLPLIGEGWIKVNQEGSEAEAGPSQEAIYEQEERESRPMTLNVTPDSSSLIPENHEFDYQEEIPSVGNKRKSSETITLPNHVKNNTTHENDVMAEDIKQVKSDENEAMVEQKDAGSNNAEISQPKTYATLLKTGNAISNSHINVTATSLPPAGFSKAGQLVSPRSSNLQKASSTGPVSAAVLSPTGVSSTNQYAIRSPEADGGKVTSSMTQTQDSDRYQTSSNNNPRSSFRGNFSRPVNSNNAIPRDRYIPDSHQIFVGNLPNNCTERELEDLFGKFGKVAEVRLRPDQQKQGRRVPSFGFVVFESEDAVPKVLSSIPILMDNGHRLNIETKKVRSNVGDFNNSRGNLPSQRNSNNGYQGQQRPIDGSQVGYSAPRVSQNGNLDKENISNEDDDGGNWTSRTYRGRVRSGGQKKI